MPNKVTGSTDTSGALSVNVNVPKCAIIVAEKKVGSAETVDTLQNTIMDISGTADAIKKFGSLSPVAELVRIMITNGVTYIKGIMVGEYGVSKTYTSIAEAYADALAKTMTDTSIKMIVLDTMDTTVLPKVKTHLAIAEQEDMFRYCCVGCAKGSDDNAKLAGLAESLNDKRMFVVGPNVVSSTGTELDGIYTAAGLASSIMTETSDPALPMNGVPILGFGGVTRPLLRTDKDTLVNAGIVPLTFDGGNPTVFRLVTSKTKDGEENDAVWQEGSTVFIADDVLESVETRIRRNYKRTKNVARVLESIRTDVIDVLEQKNGLEIIQEFDKSTVSVIKDPQDLYGALVDYEFKVVTPLYTVTINQHMKL